MEEKINSTQYLCHSVTNLILFPQPPSYSGLEMDLEKQQICFYFINARVKKSSQHDQRKAGAVLFT